MLTAHGLTEAFHGYGFLAVYVAAVTFRGFEERRHIHAALHHFVEQAEVIGLIVVMVVMGMALARGVPCPLGCTGGLVAAVAVVRPVVGWAALAGTALSVPSRAAVAVLGIRGVGAICYMAYGLGHAPFSLEVGRLLWAVLVVLVSIVLHGCAAPRLMGRLGERAEGRRRTPVT